nr:hypothetical protein CFP56_69329 [Quercus suber]
MRPSNDPFKGPGYHRRSFVEKILSFFRHPASTSPLTAPTRALRLLRLALHLPEDVLQDQEIPLQHLGPVLHVADLFEALGGAVAFALQLGARLCEVRGGGLERAFLLRERGGVAVEIRGQMLVRGGDAGAGRGEGGEDRGAGVVASFAVENKSVLVRHEPGTHVSM